MAEDKKSVFLSTVDGTLNRFDLANAKEEEIKSRQRAVVGLLKDDFENLISEISGYVRVYQLRLDNCITFRIAAWSDSSDSSSYWEVGIYPYGTSSGSACQLSVRFFPVGVEQFWRAEAPNSQKAFQLISEKLGEIVGSEVSLREKYNK